MLLWYAMDLSLLWCLLVSGAAGWQRLLVVFALVSKCTRTLKETLFYCIVKWIIECCWSVLWSGMNIIQFEMLAKVLMCCYLLWKLINQLKPSFKKIRRVSFRKFITSFIHPLFRYLHPFLSSPNGRKTVHHRDSFVNSYPIVEETIQSIQTNPRF